MVVGAIGGRTELAIVGAGPGGYVAALRAADAGLDVTLIERDRLGGTCLNVGCIPSKALIEIADLRHRVLAAESFGLDATVAVDGERMGQRLDAVSGQLRRGVTALLADAGVSVIVGDANVARYDRLSIAAGDHVSHLEFDNLILATGSRATELASLPIGDRILTSTEALALTSVPQSMAIVGGGYIGIELGTAWAKLGALVTIVEAAPTILPLIPADLRRPVEARLAELGIEIRTNERARGPTDSGLVLESGALVEAEVIVVAVGRTPNSDRAGIERLGVEVDDRGHIRVDDTMRAGTGIYAIGDLVAGPALAHKASAQAETAVDAICGRPAVPPGVIPAVIFSDPEIMSVGVDLDQAKAWDLRVHRFPHAASGRARTIGQHGGATFLVSDEENTVVGVHAVGPHASELAGEATLAVEMAATVEDLALTVHPHPTMSESIAEVAWLANGSPLHVRR